ncbi:peptide deformylase [Gilvimarinus sp. F26214L]|uniref:peptide deformylase n=1 Tax=Gilvimarinus sp. DZF01 TaxID=3461371 RepID=UPI00404551DB
MAQLEILEFPDPRLRTQAKPVEQVDDRIRKLVADMFDTMYAAPGIGLAATQVNVHEQVVVMDISEDRSQPLVFINPEITVLDQEVADYEEGCLSVPGYSEAVARPTHIQVKALNEKGEAFELQPTDLLAVCIQHEVDHLKGKLFVDYLSPLKRQRIRSKLEKEQRVRA